MTDHIDDREVYAWGICLICARRDSEENLVRCASCRVRRHAECGPCDCAESEAEAAPVAPNAATVEAAEHARDSAQGDGASGAFDFTELAGLDEDELL